MRDRLRGLFGLDAVVPVVLVVAATLMALEPTFFGVRITDRAIVLSFFGFLGVDALIERSGRLSRIERRLNTLADKEERRPSSATVLRARSSFDRMDVVAGARPARPRAGRCRAGGRFGRASSAGGSGNAALTELSDVPLASRFSDHGVLGHPSCH